MSEFWVALLTLWGFLMIPWCVGVGLGALFMGDLTFAAYGFAAAIVGLIVVGTCSVVAIREGWV